MEQGPADSTYVLAVDLGTGGPKAAVLSATGRVAAHAFEAVGIHLTEDGGAEQSPQEWWGAVVASARRALQESGVPPERIVGIGCTSQWLGTVPIDGDGAAIEPAIIWMDSRGRPCGAREGTRGAQHPGVLGLEAGPLGAQDRSHPQPVGQGPGRSHPLLARPSPRRLPGCGRVPRARRLSEPAPDRLGPGVARLHHGALGHRQPGHQRHPLRRRPDCARRSRAAPSCPTSCRPAASWEGFRRRRPKTSVCWRGRRSWPVPGDLHSAAVGSGAVADFAAHLYIGTSSWISCHVPFKKTDALTNVASIPSGLPGRYVVADEHETGGACLTWFRDTVAFPATRWATLRRPTTSSPSSTTSRRRSRRAPTACCSRRGSTASARPSMTTPSGVASTTSRCHPPGPTWSVPSSRGWR